MSEYVDGVQTPWAWNQHDVTVSDWDTKRLEADRVKSLERIEEERIRVEKQVLDREQREREDARKRLPKPRTADEDRLHKMRLEYKRLGIKINF